MRKINLKGVSLQTWVRTAVLILALINQALVIFGISNKDIDLNSWASYASYIFTAVSSIWSWWKNNSFTPQAQEADKALKKN
ncbi:MAG: phage holin [Clostridia bacterium]|nr:phage holin [Clostridia bacterium]